MKDTTILDDIIIGRIDPHIYAFRTNTVPNYLKVGDTYRPVSVRIAEWKQIFQNLEHLEDWKWTAKTEDGKYFRDYAVHSYLEEVKHLHRLQPNDIKGLPYYSREFFQNAQPKDIEEAISDINNKAKQVGSPYQFFSEEHLPITMHYERTESFDPRPNQEKTIKAFIEARNNGRRNLLMYAVMRFGKSFTSMCCAKEMDAKIVLIVSAKADVKNEWKRTIESHVDFVDYDFIDSDVLIREPKYISKLIEQGKRAAIFLTLQDLKGDKIKDKHRDIFGKQIDLLIIDETHFGARAEEYGKILKEKKQINKEKKQLSKLSEQDQDKTFDDLEEWLKLEKKQLKVDTTLHLSGTPYRILMGSEFKPEDIIAFYQFTDIIDDKEEWDNDNLKNDDVKEWDNPYYGFPQMIRFAFNPNESSRRMLEDLKKQGKTALLSELFRPISISEDKKEKKHLYFEHEKEVLDLLEVIDGSKEDENILGFLDYKKIKDGFMCRHIVCVLPFCASCDAFEKLLETNKNRFKNLSQYKIVNISGLGNKFKTTEEIKQHITEIERNGRKSITLTVNRMLTGSTVREWDTMLFLKDTASPQEYDQTIFRLQNQYVKTYKDDKNESIVYNMKPQTLIVDFDPNRMFVMQEQKSKIYNVNTEERGNEKLEERIRKELKISPIIVINKEKLLEVNPTNIMDAVRKYSASRTVMDEARDIPIDYAILKDPYIQSFIEGLEPIDSKKGLNNKPIEGDGDDLMVEKYDESKSTEEVDTNKAGLSDSSKNTDEKDDSDKRLASYFAKILFFALLTDDAVDSFKCILKNIRRDNNRRIANNIGLTENSINYLYDNLNPFILQDLDYKIKNINELIRDTSLEPLNRVEVALKKFGRFSSSEIVTPSKLADEVTAQIPEDGIDENTRFLDIASKQAEFACAIFRRFGDKVRNNIFSLPTSSLAYEFTRKVYSLLELPIENVISSFNSYDIIKEKKETYINTLKNMNFNVIVGNPPYQEVKKLATKGNNNNTVDIFGYFREIALNLSNVVTLIYPAKEYQRGDNNFINHDLVKVRIYNGSSKETEKNIPGEDSVFGDAVRRIPGDVGVFLWNKKNPTEKIIYQDCEIERTDKILPIRREFFSIAKKLEYCVNNTNYSIRKCCESDFVEKNPSSVLSEVKDRTAKVPNGYTKVITNNKGGSGGKSHWYYIKTEHLDYIQPNVYKVVISSAYPNEAFRNPNNIEILSNNEMFGRTKKCIYYSNNHLDVNRFIKYLKTKFVRLIADMTPYKFMYYLPDFNLIKNDIDWSKTISEIDQQLYKKYNFSENEINFIETTIKSLD